MKISDLQVVVIEGLCSQWDNQEVRQLYCDMMAVKFQGYSSVYGENVISSDKADYFGTHLMVCQKGDRLKPLFGYKSVTLNKCREYHLKFPALSLVGSDGEPECFEQLKNIIESAESRGESISFDYSWAQDPSLKGNRSKEQAQLFRDLVMMLVVHHHFSYGIKHMLTCGVVKVKTDLFFDKMGLQKISDKSLFSQKDLNNEPVHIFHSDKFSNYAMAAAEGFQELWENRLEFRGNGLLSGEKRVS